MGQPASVSPRGQAAAELLAKSAQVPERQFPVDIVHTSRSPWIGNGHQRRDRRPRLVRRDRCRRVRMGAFHVQQASVTAASSFRQTSPCHWACSCGVARSLGYPATPARTCLGRPRQDRGTSGLGRCWASSSRRQPAPPGTEHRARSSGTSSWRRAQPRRQPLLPLPAGPVLTCPRVRGHVTVRSSTSATPRTARFPAIRCTSAAVLPRQPHLSG